MWIIAAGASGVREARADRPTDSAASASPLASWLLRRPDAVGEKRRYRDRFAAFLFFGAFCSDALLPVRSFAAFFLAARA